MLEAKCAMIGANTISKMNKVAELFECFSKKLGPARKNYTSRLAGYYKIVVEFQITPTWFYDIYFFLLLYIWYRYLFFALLKLKDCMFFKSI